MRSASIREKKGPRLRIGLLFGSPFRNQMIWLAVSSIALVLWSIINLFLNLVTLVKKQVSSDTCCDVSSRLAAIGDWNGTRQFRDSWAQTGIPATLFWLVTVVVITTSVATFTGKWALYRRKWGSAWVVGGWFVPVVNLVVPCQVLRESQETIRQALAETSTDILGAPKRVDAGKYWFVGSVLTLSLFGVSFNLIRSKNYQLDTFGIWCSVLASVFLVGVVGLAFVYFARQNRVVNRVDELRHKGTTDERLRRKGSLEPPAHRTEKVRDVDTISEQIRALGKLRDEGLLTPSEFERKKKELLDRI